MQPLSILIADTNEEFSQELAGLLGARFRVAVCSDGKDALAWILDRKPEILVMDLMLPGYDGFYLLEKISQIQDPPAVFVTTRCPTPYVQEKALSYGISGMMVKPCDLLAAEANIRALAQRLPLSPARADTANVARLLMRLGFEPHREGYEQLLLTIPLYAAAPKEAINKVTYAKVAEMVGANDYRTVEHSIRAAILSAWDKGDRALWNSLFPEDPRKPGKAPSNKIFISRIVEQLNLESIQEESLP